MLRRHEGKVSGLASLDNVTADQREQFKLSDLLKPPILKPFLVTLMLMILLQLSGQGVVTFYAGHIFQQANISLRPNDCALIVGLTYLLSSILSLVLRNLIGRRLLLLFSQVGMGLSMMATGVYFQSVAQPEHNQDLDLNSTILNSTLHQNAQETVHKYQSLLLLPVLQVFTFFYNIGLGSLTWTVATEILPPRLEIKVNNL